MNFDSSVHGSLDGFIETIDCWFISDGVGS